MRKVKKDTQTSPKVIKLPLPENYRSYEKKYSALNFFLMPILAFRGRKRYKKYLHKKLTSIDLMEPFFSVEDFKKQYEEFLNHEARLIKKDPFKHLNRHNCLTAEELNAMILAGIDYFEKRNIPIARIADELFDKFRNEKETISSAQITRYIFNGIPDINWYKEENEKIKQLLPNYDCELFLDLLAVTSPRSKINSNVVMAFKAYRELGNGANFKGFLKSVKKKLGQIHRGEEVASKSEKTLNFMAALKGKKNAVPVDVWLVRAFDCERRYIFEGKENVFSPTPKITKAITDYIRYASRMAGLEPRQMSSLIWRGIRNEHPRLNRGSMNTRYSFYIAHYLDRTRSLFDEIET